jgi:predicted nuclease with TOPRIM domain
MAAEKAKTKETIQRMEQRLTANNQTIAALQTQNAQFTDELEKFKAEAQRGKQHEAMLRDTLEILKVGVICQLKVGMIDVVGGYVQHEKEVIILRDKEIENLHDMHASLHHVYEQTVRQYEVARARESGLVRDVNALLAVLLVEGITVPKLVSDL